MIQRNRWGLFEDPPIPQPRMGVSLPEIRMPLSLGLTNGGLPDEEEPYDPFARVREMGAEERRKAKWGGLMRAGLSMLAHGGRNGTMGESIARAAMTGLESYAGSTDQIAQAEQAMAQKIQDQMRSQALSDPRMAEAMGLTPDQMRIFGMLPLDQQTEVAQELIMRDPAEEERYTVSSGSVITDSQGNVIFDNRGGEEPAAPVRVTVGNELRGINPMTGEAVWSIPLPPAMPSLNPWESSESLRKEFMALPAVKDWNVIAPQYETARAALLDDTAAGDMNLVYAVAKVVDPGSVVREGEYGLVVESNSIPERVKGQLNYLLGGGRLTPDARGELLRVVERYSRARWNAYASVRSAYDNELVPGYGANPRWVFAGEQTPSFADGYNPVSVLAPGQAGAAVPPPRGPVTPSGGGQSWSFDPALPLTEQFPWLNSGGGG